MIPTYANIAFFVETRTESYFHVVGDKTAARTHEGAVSEFAPRLFVPKDYICKAKNLVVKKIYSSYV